MNTFLKDNENDLIEICQKIKYRETIDNLFNFFDEKIAKNLTKFSEFKHIFFIIDDIVKKIINLKSKRSFKEKPSKKILKKIEDKNAFYIQNKNDINLLRTSLPLSFFKSKTFNTEEDSNVNLASKNNGSSKTLNSEWNEEKHIEGLEDIDNNDDDENEEEIDKARKKYKFSRMYSSNIILTEDQYNIDNTQQEEDDKDDEDDEDDKDENKEVKGFLRFTNKKAATIGGSISNNLEMKLFNFQKEQQDNNYIIKTKKSGSFLNFIDIDLFLQYIALGKKFFDNEEENTNLIEGFCLQYQTFIFPETLINKIISCFNYFYSQYSNKGQIIEEKNENEDDNENQKNNNTANDNENKEKEKENENNNSLHEGNSFIIRKGTSHSSESLGTIPFGLIDFLYTFIKMHNIYYHNEFSNELIVKIDDFLKQLINIKQ